jgi:cell division inhibitor SepF
MGFMTGVWRLLGAAEEDHEHDQIVEYPGPHRAQREDRGEQPEQRIISMPTVGDMTTMCVFKPLMEGEGQPGFSMRSYASHLLDRRALILDVNELATADLDEATRVIDYLSGVAEAVSGRVYEVSKNIFLFAPSNVDLAGDSLKQVEVY